MRLTLFAALLAWSCAACSPPTDAAAAQASKKAWVTLAQWSGNGMRETESFETHGGEWRIRWTTTNERLKGAGILQIFVYRADGREMVSLAANQQGEASGESFVRSKPGAHYLMISGANIDWTITAEEQR